MPLHKSRFLEKQTYDRFRLLFKLINILKIIIVFPISILLIIIYPFFKIKLGRIYSKTIGNSVSAIEIFFYESKEFVNKNNKKFYVWYHDPIIANKFWIKKIKKKIIVLPGIIIQPLTQIFKFLKLENKFKIPIRDFKSSKNPALIRSIANLSPTSDIHGVLSKYPPLIKFNSDELVRGECFLNHIGIKQNDKIVCIHNRSNSYRDENFNSLRNSSIKNFQSAIEFLLNKNIKVIRMGRDEKKNLI